MILSELLTHVASAYLDDRTTLVDGDADSLWSDETIVNFLNEAQRIICRRAWMLVEYGVAPAGVIVLATGKVIYPLHASVLKVFDATPSTQDGPLGRTSDLNLRAPYPLGFGAFEMGEAASLAGGTTSNPGAAVAFASDAATRTLRVWPAPAAAQNGVKIALKIARMPITFLTLDDTDASPECPEETHMAMCDYAAARCLLLPNVDSDQKAEGRALLADFHRQVREFRQDMQRFASDGYRWGFNTATSTL